MERLYGRFRVLKEMPDGALVRQKRDSEYVVPVFIPSNEHRDLRIWATPIFIDGEKGNGSKAEAIKYDRRFCVAVQHSKSRKPRIAAVEPLVDNESMNVFVDWERV
jgi:hypothetical protein